VGMARPRYRGIVSWLHRADPAIVPT
jgi:hypothetical protein